MASGIQMGMVTLGINFALLGVSVMPTHSYGTAAVHC
jgi:hypothetical protein